MVDLVSTALRTVGGGKYLPIPDLEAKYPNGVTVNGMKLIKSDNSKSETGFSPIFTFAEDPNSYFYASAGDLGKWTSAWLSKNSVEEIDESLWQKNLVIKVHRVLKAAARNKPANKLKETDYYTQARVIGTVENVQPMLAVENNEPKLIGESSGNGEIIDEETGEVIKPADNFGNQLF